VTEKILQLEIRQTFAVRLDLVTDTTQAQHEGLRERKKRLTRQLISDTATEMFLERGFDEVRISEIAVACEVSEKTIYNYFPTKESLVLDREESIAADIRWALGPDAAGMSPVDAAVHSITEDMSRMLHYWSDGSNYSADLTPFRRFWDMLESTPSLRAAQREMMDRLIEVAAAAMAERAGINAEEPEPLIAAIAIMGLWRVQFTAMHKYADGKHSPSQVKDLVLAEVKRAARLIDTGLWSFSLAVQGHNGRESLREATQSANEARKQVMAAMKQAKEAWRMMVIDAHRAEQSAGRHRGRANPIQQNGRRRPWPGDQGHERGRRR
jgi:AcrR family transcriptional regulator